MLGTLWYKDATEKSYTRGPMTPNEFLQDPVRVAAWGNNGKSLQQEVSTHHFLIKCSLWGAGVKKLPEADAALLCDVC